MADVAAYEVNIVVVPVSEGVGSIMGRRLIGFDEVFHRAVGEDGAPAEGVAPGVLFDDGDVVGRVGFFHQDRKKQPPRPAADADDFHEYDAVSMIGVGSERIQ